MTRAQAQRAVLKPHRTRANKYHQAGWFYVESDGLSVLSGGNDGFAKAVKIKWAQIERALRLKKIAFSAGGSP